MHFPSQWLHFNQQKETNAVRLWLEFSPDTYLHRFSLLMAHTAKIVKLLLFPQAIRDIQRRRKLITYGKHHHRTLPEAGSFTELTQGTGLLQKSQNMVIYKSWKFQISQSINQSINQSIGHAIESINQSTDRTNNQTINQSIDQSIEWSLSHRIKFILAFTMGSSSGCEPPVLADRRSANSDNSDNDDSPWLAVMESLSSSVTASSSTATTTSRRVLITIRFAGGAGAAAGTGRAFLTLLLTLAGPDLAREDLVATAERGEEGGGALWWWWSGRWGCVKMIRAGNAKLLPLFAGAGVEEECAKSARERLFAGELDPLASLPYWGVRSNGVVVVPDSDAFCGCAWLASLLALAGMARRMNFVSWRSQE